MLYILAIAGAAIIIWQTIALGQKAVLSWACWTDFYPAIWIAVAVLQHLISVITMRLSLHDGDVKSEVYEHDIPMVSVGPSNPPPSPSITSSTLPLASRRQPKIMRNRSINIGKDTTNFGVLAADISSGGLILKLARIDLAIWSKVAMDLANANFLYGTIIFSSLSLVSGVTAIKVVLVYGFVATTTKVLTTFILDDIVEERYEDLEGSVADSWMVSIMGRT